MGIGPEDQRERSATGEGDAGEPGEGAPRPESRSSRTSHAAPVVLLSKQVSGPSPALTEARMVDMLGRVHLFAGLGPRPLARIARIADERLYAPGEAIFRTGDPSEGLFLVIEGTVRISRQVGEVGDETLAVLRTGQHFGEMSLIDDHVSRSADATAHHRVRAILLPRLALRDLMFVDRELAHDLLWRFVRLLTQRVREANDRLAMLQGSSRF